MSDIPDAMFWSPVVLSSSAWQQLTCWSAFSFGCSDERAYDVRRYAEDTSVSVEKSRAEIEGLLNKYGATSFMSGLNQIEAVIAFEMKDRKVMFRLPLPNKNDKGFTHYSHKSGKLLARASESAQAQWEQACRSRWRALALAIKAKLEAVAVGITTFEDEFLAHIVLHDGMTVGQHVRPRIAEYYDSGRVTPLLPGPSSS